MNIVQLISGADGDLLKLIRENVDNHRFTILEAVCLRADGSRFYAEIIVNGLKEGNSSDLCVVIRDVSDRKEAEQELLSANEDLLKAQKAEVRMETVATLYYAMNNPLQILMCMAELDENKEYKKQISRIIEVMNDLRSATDLEPVVDSDGTSRYDLPVRVSLEPCDKTRMLVVDDEAMLRQMFVKALSVVFPNMTIDMAANGRDACEVFSEHHHRLIVMDLSMPVMDGEKAFRNIQDICETKGWDLPAFVFCTGYVVSESVQDILNTDARHAQLTKPLQISELVKTVQASVKAEDEKTS